MMNQKLSQSKTMELPSSAKDLLGLLEFLKSPDYQGYLTKLADATRDYNSSLDRLTRGRELESMALEVEQVSASIKAEQETSKVEAAQIINDAKVRAKEIINSAQKNADSAQIRSDALLEKVKTREADSLIVEKEQRQTQERFDAEIESLRLREDAVTSAEQEVKRKQDILSKL
jgi:hypothetical protein